jgi:predicted nucleic acid-binding protein
VIAYFDTSAFVKLLIAEPGSAEVGRIWDTARRAASSVLLYPEGRAALAKARRDRRLDAKNLSAAVEDLEGLWARVDRVLASVPLTRRAGALADEYGLRGCDAVHLASAETIASADVVLVSTDERLCAAARLLGLAVARIAIG